MALICLLARKNSFVDPCLSPEKEILNVSVGIDYYLKDSTKAAVLTLLYQYTMRFKCDKLLLLLDY